VEWVAQSWQVLRRVENGLHSDVPIDEYPEEHAGGGVAQSVSQ
jgi:hypothetical protein